MFAFSLWDRATSKLTLCRDRLGEKPLYYGWIDEKFIFGSELRSIEKLGLNLEICEESLSQYLYYGYVPAPRSIYKGIYKLLPGTYIDLKVNKGIISKEDFSANPARNVNCPKEYWSLAGVGNPRTNYNDSFESVDALDTLLREVIRDQCSADVPFGAFLSGGVDSSLVVAIMQQVNKIPINTFTVGFEEKEFNEAIYAKKVADHLGTNHTEIYISEKDCMDIAPKIAGILDEPIADSSQIPTYIVSKLAKKHVTVCLSGDAGDELFAGYNRYVSTKKYWAIIKYMPISLRSILNRMISAVKPHLWDSVYRAFVSLFKLGAAQNNFGLKIQKIGALLECGNVKDAYMYLISYWQETAFPLKNVAIIDKNLFSDDPKGLDDIERFMFWDLLSYLPGDNLAKVDRASMAVSLETRLPLLNHRLVEFAWKSPLSLKIQNAQSKWLMRQVLYRYVPEELINRPKMGFSVPISNWLRGTLRDWADALIKDMNNSYFDKSVVLKTWEQHQKGVFDHGNKLWCILMFLSWESARKLQ
jgi:asparagine synthase (glutamine-hydrolysing)